MPSAGVVTRNLNPLLYRPGLDKNFRDGYQFYEKQYPSFLKVSTVDTPEVNMASVTGPNRLHRLGDGEAPPTFTIEVGRKAMAVDREFASAYAVTRRAQQDDMNGVVNQGAKWLGEAAFLTNEYQAAALLDDAFLGNTFLGEDGLRLCTAAHTGMGTSATYSNLSTIGFSLAGVTELMRLADNAVNQQGDYMKVSLSKIIIPGRSQSIKQAAWKIFGQSSEPFTANNDENAVKGLLGKVSVVNNQYMTSTSNYFMIDDRLNDAHFRVRKTLETSDHVDPRTRILYVQAYTRFMIYFYNPRGWYGANPS